MTIHFVADRIRNRIFLVVESSLCEKKAVAKAKNKANKPIEKAKDKKPKVEKAKVKKAKVKKAKVKKAKAKKSKPKVPKPNKQKGTVMFKL